MEIIGHDLSETCFIGHCRSCGAVLKAGLSELRILWDVDEHGEVGYKGSCAECGDMVYFRETTEAEIETLRDYQ